MFSLMGFREAGYLASPKTICPLINLSNTKKATINSKNMKTNRKTFKKKEAHGIH